MGTRILVAAVAPGLVPEAQGASRCDGKKATIVRGAGDQMIQGTAHKDVIVAGKGNDTIVALGGNDVVCGGTGADILIGDSLGVQSIKGGNDRLFGGTGTTRSEAMTLCPETRETRRETISWWAATAMTRWWATT